VTDRSHPAEGTDPVLAGSHPEHGDEVVAARPEEADRRATPFLPLDVAGTFVVGFAMGTADTVPGFSGGTVALVAGIYERLIANVRQGARAASLLVRGQVREFVRALGVIEWVFVVALLSGVLSAILLLASFLERQLEAAPVTMSAIFLGLVIGATLVAVRELREPGARHVAIGAGVAVVTFVALGFRASAGGDPSLLFVLVAGSIAICAMILPGISGSFLLLILGVYEFIIGSVSDRDLLVLAVFAVGCLLGLAAFSTLLNWLLQRSHDLVLAALLGLMVGSARVLWPWPSAEGVGDPQLGAPVAAEVPLIAAIVVGAALGRRGLRVRGASGGRRDLTGASCVRSAGGRRRWPRATGRPSRLAAVDGRDEGEPQPPGSRPGPNDAARCRGDDALVAAAPRA
jgi:putative membrane protein